MTTIHILDNLEPFLNSVGRIYEVGGGIITVLAILWILNFVAGLIRNTYSAGYSLGKFYRAYIHRYLKTIVVALLSLIKKKVSNSSDSTKETIKA
ncbi:MULTISPECIES: hypothetical protein [Prochlorococcus]|uniref:hypothetical protein n=1 Tax=Prochlorococcus TaxID=1218 RepID=UPI0007B3B9C9|nr:MULTISPECIES: hypothetical protein [Prochlorococcus]KZR60966.1 hypothetical protein PMIT1312_02638 [Prochlorococcus marinus str. MIT 1312]KZR79823.1 hypothetical protein PMIT1327_01886 [Prochlorococcus marinus str. MIT 1327]NMO84990.1 hypothetical protein [Prochlorococcus sp. P1344]NMP12864.1 hypothetical protein [Prochlorococcus sp.P1363]